jgi:hypothetical protein
MSFVGDLEHLPIVDVIQLLHATRKSGTLCLKSAKGESQLVFSDGCIVSANHSNNSVRIGQILVQMDVISPDLLESSLAAQKSAGTDRRPLIASLIESGKLKKEDAFKGLETLIEMTIVEVLTWTEGTFELDVDTKVISDEYRYIPEKLKLDLNLNTQNVLMDALRIYDEKKRDGTLLDEPFLQETTQNETAAPAIQNDQVISIDDLGLDVLDDLEKIIPGFFTPAKMHDPTIVHREKVGNTIDDLPQEVQDRLLSYLAGSHAADIADSAAEASQATTHALILFSCSELTCYMIMTVCKQEGFFTFATDEEENLDHIINQSLSRDLIPVLLVDQPENTTITETTLLVRRVINKFPDLAVFHLAAAFDYTAHLDVIRSGARVLLPKPDKQLRPGSFAQEFIYLLETLRRCLKIHQPAATAGVPNIFMQCMNEISPLRELHEITAVIDRYLATTMGRAITFVSRKSELVCDTLNRSGSAQPLAIHIPVAGNSQLHNVLANGSVFYGESKDQLLAEKIYSLTGAPLSQQILVAPLKCLGRVVAVMYADFGSKPLIKTDLDLIAMLIIHAGLVYENALYRKKFEKMLQAQQ